MNVLVACECSQEVTFAFREKGHMAFSCDIEPCYGGFSEWHIRGDVIPLLSGKCGFHTEDGIYHFIENEWDLIIAFPPCTDLAVSGARHFARKRADGSQQKSVKFFMEFVSAPCRCIAIENPVGIMSTYYRKPDQIVQPWQFGHGETKATCFWLKNLPLLLPTDIVDGREQRVWKMPPGPNRARDRSKTFSGIAYAMSEQWG